MDPDFIMHPSCVVCTSSVLWSSSFPVLIIKHKLVFPLSAFADVFPICYNRWILCSCPRRAMAALAAVAAATCCSSNRSMVFGCSVVQRPGSCQWIHLTQRRRRICVSAEARPSDGEASRKSTVEIDRLIDRLRETDSQQFAQVVAENVLSFDSNFWLRLASRADLAKSEDDKADYEELSSNVMQMVERIVQKTEEKIESSTEKLMTILKPVGGEEEEIIWPPRDPKAVEEMRRELVERERAGSLDEGFLSEVNAQLRQSREDSAKPGLVAMLQTVLQLYAAAVLSKTSYSKKGAGSVDKAEEALERVIAAREEAWDHLIEAAVAEVGRDDFLAVVKKRIERTLLRTESASYKQRVLVEYLKEIQRRVE